jgi:hypothetical protein
MNVRMECNSLDGALEPFSVDSDFIPTERMDEGNCTADRLRDEFNGSIAERI